VTSYLSGLTGFTPPTWDGYSATRIDETYPTASLLLKYVLQYDTNLQAGPDGDGVHPTERLGRPFCGLPRGYCAKRMNYRLDE
jgi:hypothetical protein